MFEKTFKSIFIVPIKDLKMDQRDRSETIQSTVGEVVSMKDSQPLYYCDRFQARANQPMSRAEKSLILVSILTIFFIGLELAGGYIAHSLAIMTDAFHMISDLTSFLVSIFAIRLARRAPTHKHSYGLLRAEILGALVSIVLIWILTGVLVYMAIMRIVNGDYEVGADIMLITAGIGVAFNIIMGLVLHFGKAGHTHFGIAHSHEGGDHGHSHGTHGHSHSNINVRAAFIHVIGDLIQSVGVLIAAVIIKFTGWAMADPLCTFLFSVLVLVTTTTVFKDTIEVLMEATPGHIKLANVEQELMQIKGVEGVHSLRIWSLTMDKIACSVHLDTADSAVANNVVLEANRILKGTYGIKFITVQAQCCSRQSSPSVSFKKIEVVPAEVPPV